jgi:hypothetical protein
MSESRFSPVVSPALPSEADGADGAMPKPTGHFDWWQALVRVLASIEAVRDGRALYVLLSALSGGGLALATARASLARGEPGWAVFQAAIGLFIAFYGSNAAGLLLMDRALGRTPRDVIDALEDALGIAHRVLAALAGMLLIAAGLAGALLGLLWLSGLPRVGPWLFAGVVPLTVAVVGLVVVAGAAVVGPLTGPSVWLGASSWQSFRTLLRLIRRHLLQAVVMAVTLSGLTGLVGAGTSLVVMLGGRVMAEASVWMLGIDLAPEVLMVGLFGGGLHSINSAVVPKEAVAHTAAAAIGGGVVFAVALVLPTAVYLRGVCEVYLTLLRHEQQGAPAQD